MATNTTTIQLRIDKKTKAAASAIFEKLGMDMTSGMKLFLSQVVRTKSIPFVARTENGFTPEYEKKTVKGKCPCAQIWKKVFFSRRIDEGS
jgi:addiction module RelB/DinJ family antitoxin